MKKIIPVIMPLVSVALFSQDLLLNYTFNGSTADVSGNIYDGVPFGIVYGKDHFGNENSSVEIYNSLGQMVYKTTSNAIDVTTFTAGIYVVRLESEGIVAVKKIIVRWCFAQHIRYNICL